MGLHLTTRSERWRLYGTLECADFVRIVKIRRSCGWPVPSVARTCACEVTTEGPEGLGDKAVSVQAYIVEQVAEMLQIGRDKVYGLIRTGRLHSIKIDRLRRITAGQLADFVASVEEAP